MVAGPGPRGTGESAVTRLHASQHPSPGGGSTREAEQARTGEFAGGIVAAYTTEGARHMAEGTRGAR